VAHGAVDMKGRPVADLKIGTMTVLIIIIIISHGLRLNLFWVPKFDLNISFLVFQLIFFFWDDSSMSVLVNGVIPLVPNVRTVDFCIFNCQFFRNMFTPVFI
jgi:hypothetical protein